MHSGANVYDTEVRKGVRASRRLTPWPTSLAEQVAPSLLRPFLHGMLDRFDDVLVAVIEIYSL